MPACRRVAGSSLEKPFGEDLESAVALNALLADAWRRRRAAVFRVDHVLGMATVAQPARRCGSPTGVLEPLWNSAHIEQVDILWEETLALEGRAGYYDRAGALKDVIQNHLLQILSLIAMEPPAQPDERGPARPQGRRAPLGAAARRRRGRAANASRALHGGPDRRGGRDVPAYVDEDGVDPARYTETFAEVVLELDSQRWAGTEFVLRAGKALAHRRKGAFVTFRSPAGRPADALWIGIEGPDDIRLRLAGRAAGPPPELAQIDLSGEPPPSDLPAYGRVLLDVLTGGCSLSVRGDGAEEAWRVMTPVLEAWAKGHVPLEEYPAGTAGPGR